MIRMVYCLAWNIYNHLGHTILKRFTAIILLRHNAFRHLVWLGSSRQPVIEVVQSNAPWSALYLNRSAHSICRKL